MREHPKPFQRWPYVAILSAGQYRMGRCRKTLNQDPARLGSQLCLAILRGDNREAEELLDLGAPVDHQDEPDGWTPLIYSIYYDNPRGRKLLFEHGADPLVTDFAGRTTLMFAAINGDRELLCELLNKGVSPFALDTLGKSALDFAEEYRNKFCISFLRSLHKETALPLLMEENR